MISATNLEQAKNLIKISKEKPIIVQAQNDEFNRKILEYGKFNILLGIESGNRKRTIRNIDSGFNHVLAKIATKNKIALGIDMQELSNMKKEEKAKTLERLMQNIKTCRKSKTKISLLNYKDKKDAQSFLLSIGASTQQAKETLSF
ncbi:MAG TPA: hypothetical protein VI544_00230 [Candidatus Nanoarchaeia archaeon]|nr:hypothetical protein [Candidatus Nanoarchaeia archaeon]